MKWIVHRDPLSERGGRSSFYAIWLTIGSIRLQKVPSSWEYGGFSWGEWSNQPFHWNILAFHVFSVQKASNYRRLPPPPLASLGPCNRT